MGSESFAVKRGHNFDEFFLLLGFDHVETLTAGAGATKGVQGPVAVFLSVK
jgi:hypothetical protein